MVQRESFNRDLTRTARMLSGARRVAIVLLFTLLTTATAWADASTLTVNDGTSTDSDLPFNGNNVRGNTQKNEFIIPASSLTAVNGKSITAMKFYTSSPESATWLCTFKVFMKEVESTTLTGFSGTTDATTVYEGTFSCTGYELAIAFSTSYYYHGGNLLVGIYIENKNWQISDTNANFYGVIDNNAFGCSHHAIGDDTYNKCFLPKTTLTYETLDMSKNIAAATISGMQNRYFWKDGSAIDINYSVTAAGDGNTQLTKDTHYTATIKKGNDVVTGYVTDKGDYSLNFEGIAPYYGTQTKSFTVTDYINMLQTGSETVDIPEGVTSLHVYDDGGANGNYKKGCNGTLTLNAPEGKLLLLTGTVATAASNNQNPNNYLSVRNAENTELCKVYSNKANGEVVSVGTRTSSSLTLQFVTYAYESSQAQAGLDLTVEVIDQTSLIVAISDGITHGTVTTDKTTATKDETVTLTVTPAVGYEFENITGVTVTSIGNNQYTFTMPNESVTISASFHVSSLFGYNNTDNPDGSASKPYIISSTEGWNLFCDCLAEENNTTWNRFYGKTVKLADSWDNSADAITTMAGSSNHQFKGTFDGNNKTLTVNLSATTENCAPFLYVEGATIKNLKVAGTIATSAKCAAGIAAHTNGTTNITNCTSTATITSTVTTSDSDGTHGGFVAVNEGNATLNFTNCVFKGNMLGGNANSNGGFVGWNSGTKINYTDCLFAPTEITMSAKSSCTFNRNGKNKFTRTYYLTAYGDAQGTQVYTTEPTDKMYCSATAADNVNYFMPATVGGISPYYGTGGTVVPVVTAADGTVLTENTDYEVVIKKDGTTKDALDEAGNYTVTINGKDNYQGSQTIPFTVIDDVSYVYYDNGTMKSDTKAANSLTFITNQTAWGTANTDTWYVVSGAATISDRITTTGNVHLILTDGCTLTAKAGITVSSGNSLTIYGQTNGTGTLYAGTTNGSDNTCENNYAGIGGINNWDEGAGGTIIIDGGTVYAVGGQYASCIGGGKLGGYSNTTTTITINGGTVYAMSVSSSCSGIGHGYNNVGTFNININGGKVTATGRGSGVGIGCRNDETTNINITGGMVTATGGTDAAGIGGYGNTSNQTINISNAIVFATGGSGASAIGKGKNDSSEGTITKTSGVIFENNSGQVYGESFTLVENLTIPAGKTLTIPKGTTLTIKSGVTLTNNGTIANNGTVTNNGTIINNGTFSGNSVTGSGTTDFQIEIGNVSQWNDFATAVNSGTDYSKKLILLTADIEGVATMVGTGDHKFKGSFNGQGHTLTVNLSASSDNCAPFGYLEDATIQNLTVAGTITTSGKFGASIAAHTNGTTNITNCASIATIESTVTTSDTDGTHGGFVAENDAGTLNFTNCVFKGKMLGGNANSNGGFVGWNSGTKINYTDCLFAPTEITMSAKSSCTFNRNGKNDFTRTYYLTAYGDAQGIQVYAGVQQDICKKVYTHDGTDYYSKEAVSFGGVNDAYAYNNTDITITPTITYGNATLERGTDYTIKLGDTEITGDNFTVTATGNYTLTITGVNPNYYGTSTKTFQVIAALSGEGTENSPYLISNLDDWQQFATLVNGGNDFNDQFVKLADEWNNSNSVTTMVGTSDHKFSGSFDGNGKTLTVTIDGGSNTAATFQYISGATIKNLTVAGSVSGGIHSAALVGFADDNTTNLIEGVTVSAAVTTSGSHCGGILGHGKKSKTIIKDCVFSGSITGGEHVGVLWGWSDNGCTPTITNCLEKGTSYTGTNVNPVGLISNWGTVTDTYYLNATKGKPNQNNTRGIQVYADEQTDFCKKVYTHGETDYYSKETANFNGVNDTYIYSNADIEITPTFTYGGTTLTRSTDYTVQLGETVLDADGFTVTEPGTYTLTITGVSPYAGTATKTFRVFAALAGSGSSTNPYVISSFDDWTVFALNVNSGTDADKCYKLADSWDNSANAITAMVGTSDHKFSGIFDGNGKTLTVTINGGSNTAAPFQYISGATIKNLTVDGSVSGGTHTAGLVGFASDGTSESPNTIDGCTVNVAVSNPATNGNRHIGGVVGHGLTSYLAIKNTVFSGTMSNSYHYAGGLQGWSDGNTLTIENCLFKGSYTGSASNGFHPVAIHNTGKTTTATVDECYYTAAPTLTDAAYIAATGTLVFTTAPTEGISTVVTAADNNTYYMAITVSGVLPLYTFTTNGSVTVTPIVTAADGTVLAETTDYTVTVKLGNTDKTTTLNEAGTYTLTITGVYPKYSGTVTKTFQVFAELKGSGSSTDPYVISSVDDWTLFTLNVNSGTGADKCYKLSDDWVNSESPITTMAGTSDHKFSGTFDGNNKTLTVSLSATTDNCAPFAYVDGATIQNLTVAGTITTSKKFGASIAAHTNGTTNITNCISTATIESTVTNNNGTDGTHGGFVAVNEGDATLNITSCVFKGKMLGGSANSNGGFVGYNSGTKIKYTDCLFAPADISMSSKSSCTFNRNGNNEFTRTYYTTTFGDAQGDGLVYSFSAGAETSVPVNAADGNTYYINTGYKTVSTISTVDGWNDFAGSVCLGNTYDGLTVKLADSWDNSSNAITTMAGSSNHQFKGTFDGNNKTLTVNLSATTENCAPFLYVEGATIQNLTVTGTIATSAKCAAGIAAHTNGLTNRPTKITNCTSTVAITSTVDGDGTHGGFVAVHDGGNLEFQNCVFAGSITGEYTIKCAGFVGWNQGKVKYTDCLQNGTLDLKEEANSATFNRNSNIDNKSSNYYYVTKYGDAQGTQVYQLTMPTTLPTGVTVTADVSAGNGTTYDGAGYFKAEATITLSHNYEGHTATYTVTKDGTSETVAVNNSQFTMPAANATLSVTWDQPDSYDVTIDEGSGSGAVITLPEGETSITAANLMYDRTLSAPTETNKDVTIGTTPAMLYTTCLPTAPTANENVKYYTLASVSGSTLHFTEVDGNPQADTPYLVAITGSSNVTEHVTGSDVTLKKKVTSTPVDGYTMIGTQTGLTNSDAISAAGESGDVTYILQSGGNWGRVKNDTEAHKAVYIPPFRAFIVGPEVSTSNSARQMNSSFDDDATGIDTLRLIDRDGTERWYDLNGRRIEKPTQKGVYIRNGKKIAQSRRER